MRYLEARENIKADLNASSPDVGLVHVHRESLETILEELDRVNMIIFNMRGTMTRLRLIARRAESATEHLNDLLDEAEPDRPTR
jgi:rRNA pseudouridine-1189 N-methylase Emg1 (Nep1/Mra1 family)